MLNIEINIILFVLEYRMNLVGLYFIVCLRPRDLWTSHGVQACHITIECIIWYVIICIKQAY